MYQLTTTSFQKPGPSPSGQHLSVIRFLAPEPMNNYFDGRQSPRCARNVATQQPESPILRHNSFWAATVIPVKSIKYWVKTNKGTICYKDNN
jgi:hypothetical protein